RFGREPARGSARSSLENRAGLLDPVAARPQGWNETRERSMGGPAGDSGKPVRRYAHRASSDGRAMSERLSIAQIVVLCGYAAGMAGGQILFKLASLRLTPDASLFERAASLLQNWLFLAALAVYLALSVLWVWILSFTPD